MKTLKAFAKEHNLTFNNWVLLEQSLTHRSYLNEHPKLNIEHNERLEFLGDAVLELVITEYLFENFDNPEGELTNWRSSIVRGVMLSEIAKELDLGQFLKLSKGEEKSGGKAREILLANAFEALLGAIYLDQGYLIVKDFIIKLLIPHLEDIIENGIYFDNKSRLQEMIQEQENITPEYKVMKESGPDHAKNFIVGVYSGSRLLATGEGTSKRKAEQEAAEKALEVIDSSNS